MNAKTILNKFLSTTLAVALLFSLSPLAATATEPETADAATATDASTAPAVSANTTDETVAETPAESPEPQYSEDDYTYMYLVTEKKDNCKKDGKKYYDKINYQYNEFGLVSTADGRSNRPGAFYWRMDKTEYQYEDGNLVSVKSPYYVYLYSYNTKGKIKRYDMDGIPVMGYDGPTRYKHTLKYLKKKRSVCNSECKGVLLLSRGSQYFFSKDGKILKAYNTKREHKKGYGERYYYYYDRKGNINKIKYDNMSDSLGLYDYTHEYKMSYKGKRLIKRKKKHPSASDIVSTKYSYRKEKVLKKYVKKVKDQQWRILNFDDYYELGINQPWKY